MFVFFEKCPQYERLDEIEAPEPIRNLKILIHGDSKGTDDRDQKMAFYFYSTKQALWKEYAPTVLDNVTFNYLNFKINLWDIPVNSLQYDKITSTFFPGTDFIIVFPKSIVSLEAILYLAHPDKYTIFVCSPSEDIRAYAKQENCIPIETGNELTEIDAFQILSFCINTLEEIESSEQKNATCNLL